MEILPFPKLRRLKLKKRTFHILDYTISVACETGCEFPNTYNDMILCELRIRASLFRNWDEPRVGVCVCVCVCAGGGGGGGGGASGVDDMPIISDNAIMCTFLCKNYMFYM